MKTESSDMLNLFGDAVITAMDTAYMKVEDNYADCYAMSFKEKVWQDPLQLFEGGYTDFKAITFSFDFSFVAKISSKFENVEIVVGAEFNASRINKAVAEQVAYILASADVVKTTVYRNRKFAKRIVDGEAEVRYPKFMCDHRKIYLLKADDGRVRVIFPSANFTGVSWNVNHHIENYMYCDDMECYERFLEEFKTIWSLSVPVVPDANVLEAGDEAVIPKENPIIEQAKNYVDTAIVVQKSDNPETRLTIVHYDKDIKEFEPREKEILKDIKLKENKDGSVVLNAKVIQKYIANVEKTRLSKVTVEEISEGYPRLAIDYANEKLSIDKEPLDLSPSDDEVKADITELLGAFANYNRFVNDRFQAQHNHFKLLNAMFSSVFNAKIRCSAKVRNISGLSGLPLYMLLSSPADSGKTFMVELCLKMMTGKEVKGYKYDELKYKTLSKGEILATYQETHKNIPIFIDEIDARGFTTSFGKMIKSPQDCEEHMRQEQPLTIFATNDVVPKKEMRKRIIYLTYNIKFPSRATRREYETLGGHILHRMGTAFYRKYLSMMFPYVNAELEKMETSTDLSDKYSPELMQKSSEIILDIIRQYGFEIPGYMKVLTWDADYADNSRSTYIESLNKIGELYRTDRKLFTIDEKDVTICMDKEVGKKWCTVWETSLPNELCATIIPDAEFAKIRLDRAELEHLLGVRFETGFRAKIKNWLSK